MSCAVQERLIIIVLIVIVVLRPIIVHIFVLAAPEVSFLLLPDLVEFVEVKTEK